MSPRPFAGLCESCAHQLVVRNTRGSAYSLCRRARSDAGYRKYPRLPVSACAGHEHAPVAPSPAAVVARPFPGPPRVPR